jgi:ATP-binding protein involved in chromosome partitioning
MAAPTLETDQVKKIRRSLERINRKIAIMGIKGGVGRSLVTANLASILASKNLKIGILDADINNPCIPFIFGVEDKSPIKSASNVFPVIGPMNIKIVSTKFFFPEEPITVIRGASKMEVIRQFLSDINWGDLDYLFIDLPPSIGSEFFSLLQLIPELYGAILVTTPTALSSRSLKRTIRLIYQFNLNVLGIIENMSGFICPKCKELVSTSDNKEIEKLAKEEEIDILGKIPFIPDLGSDSKCNQPLIIIEKNPILNEIFSKIIKKI